MQDSVSVDYPPPVPRKAPLRCLLTTTETRYKPRLWIPESIYSQRSSQYSEQADAIDEILAMLESSWIAQSKSSSRFKSWQPRDRGSNSTYATDASKYSQYSQADMRSTPAVKSRIISVAPTVSSHTAVSIPSRPPTPSLRSSKSREMRTMTLDMDRAKLDGIDLINAHQPRGPNKLRKVKSTSLEKQRIQLAEERSKEAVVQKPFPPHPAVRPFQGLNVAKLPPVPPIPWRGGHKATVSDPGPVLRKSKSVNFSRKRDTVSTTSSASLPAWV